MTLPDRYAGQSVSSGTLRHQDLIPAFLAVLEEDPDAYDALGESWDLDEDPNELSDEEQAELVEAIEDALNDAAPEGTFFGAHEGDGADFGFWPIAGDEPEGFR